MSYDDLFNSWVRNEVEPAPLRCDWAGGTHGHCAGDVECVATGPADLREVQACKRHHNLIVRGWHRTVEAR